MCSLNVLHRAWEFHRAAKRQKVLRIGLNPSFYMRTKICFLMVYVDRVHHAESVTPQSLHPPLFPFTVMRLDLRWFSLIKNIFVIALLHMIRFQVM